MAEASVLLSGAESALAAGEAVVLQQIITIPAIDETMQGRPVPQGQMLFLGTTNFH